MTKFSGILKGFEEFDRLLSKLPETVENKVLQQAVSGAARIGVKEIKARAPRHNGRQSKASLKYGTLLSNIKSTPSKLNRAFSGMRGVYISTRRAFWGWFLEKGTDAYKGTRTHRKKGFQFKGAASSLSSLNAGREGAGNARFRRTAAVALGSRRIPARPWFEPAFDAASDAMIKDLGKRVGDLLIKEAIKGLVK